MDVRAIDEELGRAAGKLLGATDQSDVVDAALVLHAQHGDYIVTSGIMAKRQTIRGSDLPGRL